MQKITPFIRSPDNNAHEMVEYYLSIFGPNAKILQENPMITNFSIYGTGISTLNGGSREEAKLNPAISFSLWIKDKDETKRIWDKLSDGGSILMEYGEYVRSPAYGWCSDCYGVSWQVMYDNREETTVSALVPSLMYVGANNGQTQSAMDLYTSMFPDSQIDFTRPYGENDMGENPTNLNHAEFKLNGQQFIAMDSGLDHKFTFSEGVSLSIYCDGQEEVDYYWEKLTADGGAESMCGRCKDKFGVSRQVVPKQLIQALSQSDRDAAMYAMTKMQQMKKIVIADLYHS